ncbi:anti-sigma factor antagonist [Streptomyces sp. NPDC002073]
MTWAPESPALGAGEPPAIRPPGPALLTVLVETRKDRALARVAGEIDLDQAEDLHQDLSAALDAARTGLDLDLSDVTFCDASGLRVLLDMDALAAGTGKTLVLTALGPRVSRLLELTDTLHLFTVAAPRGAVGASASPWGAGPVAPEPVVPQAVGMVMAGTPCLADDAERILACAAALACTTVAEFARALVASGGAPLPTRLDRCLRQSVAAGRSSAARPAPPASDLLLPALAETEHALGRFFDARIRLRSAPADEEARRALEDAVYTLCVLMSQPRPDVAVADALQYISVG